MRTRVALVALLVVGLWQAIAAPTVPRSHAADEDNTGISYDGDIDQILVTGGPIPAEFGGGTVSLTLTTDQSALRRIEVRNFLGQIRETSTGFEPVYFTKQSYYARPLPLVDGAATVSYALGPNIGMAPPSYFFVHIDAVSEAEVHGTVGISFYEPNPSEGVPFTATGPHAFPPDVPATIHEAHIEGQNGTISFALDDNRTMPYFTLSGVVAPACLAEPLSITAVFDEAEPLQAGAGIDVVLEHALYRMTLTGQPTRDAYSGSLTISRFDCSTELHWTTGEFPTATANRAPATATRAATPSAAPALPSTGSVPPRDSSALPVALVAALVIASALLVTFSVARLSADQSN